MLRRSVSKLLQALVSRFCCLGYRHGIFVIPSRKVFPQLLNTLKLVGEGAEIGVQRAAYSAYILENWRGRKLYSIDPWREFVQELYADVANVPQSEHEAIYNEATVVLRAFQERSQVMRCTSKEAARHFKDGQLDFVYIDAQHTDQAVAGDIRLWYRKVRIGGVLAGHDYLDGILPQGVFGVKSAVDKFAREENLELIVSKEREWKSWFIFCKH